MVNETLIKSALHDLRNQLLELQLTWDLLVDKEGVNNAHFPFCLEKAKSTVEFLQEVCKVQESFEKVEIRNILHLVMQGVRDKNISFSCMISDSFPAIVTNRHLLFLALEAVFVQALLRFQKGLLVRKEEKDNNLIILLEPGNEPVANIKAVTCDVGVSTMQLLIDLLHGSIEWNRDIKEEKIRVVLPLDISLCNAGDLQDKEETAKCQ